MRRSCGGGCIPTAQIRRRIGQSGRLIVAGALIAGLAVGMRTQTIWLTLPLLALVLLDRAGRGAAGALLGSAMTFSIGVLAWAIPLIVASGGLAHYRAAFAGQAAEQFTGLDIFLSNPTPRRMALGIIAALVGPWAAAAARVDRGRHRRLRGLVAARLARPGRGRAAARGVSCRTRSSISSCRSRYSRYALPIRACRSGIWPSEGLSAGGTTSGRIRKRGDRRGVAGRDAAGGRGRTRQYPSPAYAAVDDLQQLVVERSGQRRRRASAVCARPRDQRRAARRSCRRR